MSDLRWWYLWMFVAMVLYMGTLWLLEPVLSMVFPLCACVLVCLC